MGMEYNEADVRRDGRKKENGCEKETGVRRRQIWRRLADWVH
jgi:hypothetical protein